MHKNIEKKRRKMLSVMTSDWWDFKDGEHDVSDECTGQVPVLICESFRFH